MADNENTVDVTITADDAPVQEVSAADLAQELSGKTAEPAETAENGDGARSGENATEKRETKGNQIRAALASQRKQIFRDLGMSEEEVRELIRASKAEQMAKEDPDISVKAARRIVEAEETKPVDRSAEYKQGFSDLIDDGWTADELSQLTNNPAFLSALEEGQTFRQAARTAEKSAKPARTKRAVPTSRASSGNQSDERSESSYIEDMTPEQFKRFQDRIHREAMRGRNVRL